MILAKTKVEGEPYQTGHNAWLPWKGQQLLDNYRHARGRLEDQSFGRQLPHVRKETKNLSIAVRVALAMQYPDTGCWWWYTNLCYICQGGNPKFGGDQNMGVSSTCSLCNSRICAQHPGGQRKQLERQAVARWRADLLPRQGHMLPGAEVDVRARPDVLRLSPSASAG